MRTALEQNKIGWTMWDYQGGFGVVTKKNGTTTEDDGVLRALGLRAEHINRDHSASHCLHRGAFSGMRWFRGGLSDGHYRSHGFHRWPGC